MLAASLVAVVLAGATPAPSKLFEFQDPQITESSGVAASARRDDVLFTHNDSGDSARFFAIDRQGCTIGVFTAPGVDAVDWEDMARGRRRTGRRRCSWPTSATTGWGAGEIAVHRFPEPEVGTCSAPAAQALTPTTFRFHYEDGPKDAETLLVDPRTGQMLIVTKNFGGPDVLYAAPRSPDAGQVDVLRRVTAVEGLSAPTGGDIAPDGSSVAIRDYGSILIWRIPNGDLPAAFTSGATAERLPAPDSGRQGEALAYTRAGDGLVTTSEGEHAPVYLIPRPVACRRRGAFSLAPPRRRAPARSLASAPPSTARRRA